ncbi:MAG TPA: hypothetical protein VKA30_05435 [Actinomycetota bacterium]|nr:hypothetical protein [Actinomycetota bacterium]
MVRRSMLGSLLAGVVAFGLMASSAGSAWSATVWTVLPTANPASQTVSDIILFGVSAVSPTDAWAVGMDQIGATRSPLVEHWDGQRWRAVRVPRPANRQSWFNGVLALSGTDVWAVGESTNPQADNQDQRTLIEHWNGTVWSIVPSPNPAVNGNSGDVLMGIDGNGPNDLWTVGWAFDEPNQQIQMLLAHWNGSAWTAAPSPSPLGSAHFGTAVTTISPTDAWAVGNDSLEENISAHWNGSQWTLVPTPSLHDGLSPINDLTGVTANAGSDVWASGYEANVNNQNFMKPYLLHWNGSAWRLIPTPNQGGEGSRLNGVVALAPNDVWAVGQTQELNGTILTLTQQFNGTAWTTVPSPNPGVNGPLILNSLDGVASAGNGVVVAVGSRAKEGQCCLRTLAIGTTGG